MNVDIDNTMKQWATCLDYQQMQPHEKTILYDLLSKALEVVGADIHTINDNKLLCIVDQYSRFPIMKKADGLSAVDLIRTAKIVFTEFWPPMKIVSDEGISSVLNFADSWI